MTMTGTPTRPLLAAPLRPLAWGVVATGTLVLAVMGIWLHDTTQPTTNDNRIGAWLVAHIGVRAQNLLLMLSEPALTVGIVLAVAAVAALRRRWRVAALALLGPGLGFLLEAYVLKPGIGRRLDTAYAFPSGHETGVVTMLTLLVVIVWHARLPRTGKAAALIVALLWSIGAAAGLVRAGYHYASDTLGAMALGPAVVLLVAFGLDGLVRRLPVPERLR